MHFEGNFGIQNSNFFQVLLNKEERPSMDPVILHEPSHVSLHHLYAQSIRENMLVLSSTTRYSKQRSLPHSVPSVSPSFWVFCPLHYFVSNKVGIDVMGHPVFGTERTTMSLAKCIIIQWRVQLFTTSKLLQMIPLQVQEEVRHHHTLQAFGGRQIDETTNTQCGSPPKMLSSTRC